MVIVLVIALLFGAPSFDLPRLAPIVWEANDRNSIPEPAERKIATAYDFILGTFAEPTAQLFDAPRNVRKLFGKPKEAENINGLDEVPNSTWFTNRNFMHQMSLADIRSGPGDSTPDPKGPWTITHCKTNGVSPGMRIKDAKGDVYLIKFDPPDFPELSTSADVIGSKFFYAAGYNVPENSVVVFNEKILTANDGLECIGPTGHKVPMTSSGIEQFLRAVARTSDGRVRAIASKFLEGKPKGPFSYVGVRNDDRNDTVPHEHRRELRGMRVIAAWLNHNDSKQINTLDTYVEEDGRKFLKHHLIDFGSALGSSTTNSKNGMEGNEYLFDPGEILKAFFTLGIYRRSGDRRMEPLHPSIGYLEGAKDFDPPKWKTNFPIAAFENMTDLDGYWGAKIVASFTNDQIAVGVHTGQFSDRIAESVLVQLLEERRDKIADYWFRRVAPLDHFEINGNSLVFEDLALNAQRDDANKVAYRVTLESKETKRVAGTFKPVPLPPGEGGAAKREPDRAKPQGMARVRVSIPIDVKAEPLEVRITRTSPGWPDLTMSVYLSRVNGTPRVIGIRR